MLRLASAALLGAVLAPCANAEAQNYISVSGGYVGESDFDYATPASGIIPAGRITDDTDAGYSFSAAYGIGSGEHTRVELGVSHRAQDVSGKLTLPGIGSGTFDGDQITATSLDAALFYDFGTGKVRPYIGGLVGVAQIELNDSVVDDETNTAKLAAIAGVSVATSEKITFFADARYERLGSFEVETSLGANKASSDVSLDGFSVNVGLRFGF